MMTSSNTPQPPPDGFTEHDQAACIDAALAAAESRSAAEGLRFTPVRRRALEILLREHRAMGAYAVLDELRESGFGFRPPVAYRALDFLVTHGFAHRIERLNAFIACTAPGERHAPIFLICRSCDAVTETEGTEMRGALRAAAGESGFSVERTVIEAEGLCPACTEDGA